MTETRDSTSIKEALLSYLAAQTDVAALRDRFVVTLPLQTIDHRSVDVFVEQRMKGFFLVHDGGKTASELFSQGVHITDSRDKQFWAIAERLGVRWGEGTFQIGCQASDLHASILAVAQCACLATIEVLQHKPVVEEEGVQTRIARALARWTPPYQRRIEQAVHVRGAKLVHRIDFVSFPAEERIRPVGIQVLAPTYNPMLQAERFGFFVLDTEHSEAERWGRLAILIRAELWTKKSTGLVEQLADKVLRVNAGEEASIEELAPRLVDEIAA